RRPDRTKTAAQARAGRAPVARPTRARIEGADAHRCAVRARRARAPPRRSGGDRGAAGAGEAAGPVPDAGLRGRVASPRMTVEQVEREAPSEELSVVDAPAVLRILWDPQHMAEHLAVWSLARFGPRAGRVVEAARQKNLEADRAELVQLLTGRQAT